MLSSYCRFLLDQMMISGRLKWHCSMMGFAFFLSASSAQAACEYNPVFDFSQALYLNDYARASERVEQIARTRSTQLATFLEHILAWKRAFDENDSAGQKVARKSMGRLIDSIVEITEANPTIAHQLLAGNVMIHAARIHLLAGDVFRAALLAKQGNKFIQDVLSQAPQNADAYLAAGLYQSYVGSDDPLFAWFKRIVTLEGDPREGRELIKLAVQQSPDFAFEAIRSLFMDVQWERPEICIYFPLFHALVSGSDAPIEHQIVEIKSQLYCGQSYSVRNQILNIRKQVELGTVDARSDQLEWLDDAYLYSLAQAGEVKELESILLKYKDDKKVSLAQFSLAKAYDLIDQRQEARRLYDKVLVSDARKIYKKLAKTYIAFPYRVVKPFTPIIGATESVELACTN